MHENNDISDYPLSWDSPRHPSGKRAMRNFQRCGCLDIWKKYTDLAIKGKVSEMLVTRLRLCVEEQCWSESDIEGLSLTVNDKSHPYPSLVHRSLTNKLKNAKELKKEVC